MIGGTKLELRNMNSIHKRLSLLFVLLYLHLKSGNSLLTTFPRDTEVLVNQSTYFNCSTSILSEQIHWYHNRVGENQTNYVYYKGQFNQIYSDRFSIEINNKTGEYNLIFQSVTPSDAGQYVCQDDVGLGHSSSAELIVLESPPTCLFSMKPDGVVGPNSCDLSLETLQLSCSVSYIGNIPPILQWKMEGNDAPILEGITIDYSGKHATLNLTMSFAIEMDGEFFTCGATRSQDKQLSCATDQAKINYAIGQSMILNVAKGEIITCSANASVPCTYRWFYDNDTQHPVSYNQVLTTNRLGNHSCEASCPINGINCTFVAMRVFIVFEEESSKNVIKTLLNAILIPAVAILLIVACVLFFRMRKARNSNRTRKVETAVQPEVQVRQSPSTPDEGSIEVPVPEPNNDTSKPLLKADIIDNNIIQTHIKEKGIAINDSPEICRAIAGVAVLKNTIYVVSGESSVVELFDIKTYELKDRLEVEKMVNPWDLTSYKRNKNRCLYIMDRRTAKAKFVIKIDLNVRPTTSSEWPTREEYGNLSVTRDGDVVVTVTVSDRKRLSIYRPDGTWVYGVSLSLPNDKLFIHPSHALNLSYGKFLICYGIDKDNIHRLCILRHQCDKIENSSEKMNAPSYLAMDDTGLVYVADQGNNRVIVLNSDLTFKREVASSQNGLQGPQKLFLHGNRSTGKLFVVDLESKIRDGKLLIFSCDLS